MITVSRKRTNYRGYAKCTKRKWTLLNVSVGGRVLVCHVNTLLTLCLWHESTRKTEDRSQANRLSFDTSNLAFEIEQEIFF